MMPSIESIFSEGCLRLEVAEAAVLAPEFERSGALREELRFGVVAEADGRRSVGVGIGKTRSLRLVFRANITLF